MIPEKNRKEWEELVTGKIDFPIKSFYFKMKVKQARKLIKQDVNSINKVVSDLYELCKNHIKDNQIHEDLSKIFGTDSQKNKTIKASQIVNTEQILQKSNRAEKKLVNFIIERKNTNNKARLNTNIKVNEWAKKEAEKKVLAERKNLERIRQEERDQRKETKLLEAQKAINIIKEKEQQQVSQRLVITKEKEQQQVRQKPQVSKKTTKKFLWFFS
jgi:hypothetical protein